MLHKLNEKFVDLADFVSYAMGTPLNILFWITAVVVWISLGPQIAKHNFMPEWFTSNAFNFPLNTVTTLAELYIGFLVAAASNRSERHLKDVLGALRGKQQETLREIKLDEDQELVILARLDRQEQMILAILQRLDPRATPPN